MAAYAPALQAASCAAAGTVVVTAASASASASVIFVIMVVLLDSKPEWLLFYATKSSSLRAARFIGIASFGLGWPEKRRNRGRAKLENGRARSASSLQAERSRRPSEPIRAPGVMR